MINEGIQVIDQIIDRMFGRYTNEYKRILEDLCERMGPDEQQNKSIGFIYNGKWIPRPNSAVVVRRNSPRAALPFHLVHEMDKTTKEFDIVWSDKKQINQLLVKLLYQCNSVAELRDALPDCLWIYAGFSSHTRRVNQSYFLFDDKRLEGDLERLLPRIEYYLGMSLIL